MLERSRRDVALGHHELDALNPLAAALPFFELVGGSPAGSSRVEGWEGEVPWLTLVVEGTVLGFLSCRS